jgi:hypothetical protein
MNRTGKIKENQNGKSTNSSGDNIQELDSSPVIS